jgi:hypothetical protein
MFKLWLLNNRYREDIFVLDLASLGFPSHDQSVCEVKGVECGGP